MSARKYTYSKEELKETLERENSIERSVRAKRVRER